jgi:EYA(Eyes Absent) family protein
MGEAVSGGYPGYEAYGYGAAYPSYPNPGEPAFVPGYPDGTFSFGGWSGENAYYRNNFTGQSVWAIELFGPGFPQRPDPKMIGAAIAAAATQRRSWEKHAAHVHQWHSYYHQQAQYAQMAHQSEQPADGAIAADSSEATQYANAAHGEVQGSSGDPPPGVTSSLEPDAQKAVPPDSSDGNIRSAKKQKLAAEETASSPRPNAGQGLEEDSATLAEPSAANIPALLTSQLSSPGAGLTASGTPGGSIRFGTVYVWDLDETLIVFNSLLTGAFMDARRASEGKDKAMSAENARALSGLAEQIEDLVYAVAERALFFKQLEGRNRPCFGAALQADDGRDLAKYAFAGDGLEGLSSGEGRNRDAGEASPEEERKVAWRYRAVRDLYVAARAAGRRAAEGGGGDASPLLEAEREAAEAAIEAVDALADGWLSTAEEVLSSIWQYEAVLDRLPYVAYSPDDGELVFRPEPAAGGAPRGAGKGTRSDVNVLVTNGELLPTVAKLLLFGLAKHFHPACIYSSRDAGKLTCFREVVKRFGAAADMVAVGDGAEEAAAAARCGMRFVKVESAQDLRSVRDLPGGPP